MIVPLFVLFPNIRPALRVLFVSCNSKSAFKLEKLNDVDEAFSFPAIPPTFAMFVTFALIVVANVIANLQHIRYNVYY